MGAPKRRIHKDNLRHLPRFPDFFVTSLIDSPVAGAQDHKWSRLKDDRKKNRSETHATREPDDQTFVSRDYLSNRHRRFRRRKKHTIAPVAGAQDLMVAPKAPEEEPIV